jgi:outer membrane autotransporter protein
MPDRLSSGTVDSYHVLGYFGVRSHAFGLRAGLGYSSNDISAKRSVTIPGFTDSLRSTRDGHTVQAFGEIGYRVPLRDLTVEPIASVTQVWAHSGNFAETGGSAALTGESESLNSTTTVAGLRLATAHAGPFRLSGLLGWKHRFGDRTPSSRLAFQSGAPFDITAAGLAKDAAIVDAEASLTVSRGVSLAAAYRGEFGDRSKDNMVRGTLTIDF